jgi:hypothetical protein
VIAHPQNTTSTSIFTQTMSSPKSPPPPIQRLLPRQCKCGGCSQFGHDHHNCPTTPHSAAPAAVPNPSVNQNPVTAVPPLPPLVFTAIPEASSINREKVLHIVFDLETTGRVRQQDEDVEVGASVYEKTGSLSKTHAFWSSSSLQPASHNLLRNYDHQ